MPANEAYQTLLIIAAFSAFTQTCTTTWSGCVSVRDAVEVYLSDRGMVDRHLAEIKAARPFFSDSATVRQKREAEEAYSKVMDRIRDEMRAQWRVHCATLFPSPKEPRDA